MEHHDIVLAAEDVTKSFGGIKALEGAYLKVYASQVNAVVGENGAGKSTLMKILAGVYQDYEGRVLLGGGRWLLPIRGKPRERGSRSSTRS